MCELCDVELGYLLVNKTLVLHVRKLLKDYTGRKTWTEWKPVPTIADKEKDK
jgi:hypothetical protein